jgi:nicotinate-nucleotide pyrophosphorylase (carboxylating)
MNHPKSHIQSGGVSLKNPGYRRQLRKFFVNSIKNDLGNGLDVSSEILFSKNKIVSVKIICKSSGILCGTDELSYLLKGFKSLKKDGQKIKKNDIVAHWKGNALQIFKYERTILNLLQRMSGIASLMNEYVRMAPNVLITPTRKTILGLLDKRPCIVGGGGTHRLTLNDGILIKDNHLKAVKNASKTLRMLQNGIKKYKNPKFLEIEVNTVLEAMKYAKMINELNTSLPSYLMFDNMKPEAVKKAIGKIKSLRLRKKIFFEASGGINKKNIKKYASSGVHLISVGEITHSVKGLDFSLEVEN